MIKMKNGNIINEVKGDEIKGFNPPPEIEDTNTYGEWVQCRTCRRIGCWMKNTDEEETGYTCKCGQWRENV